MLSPKWFARLPRKGPPLMPRQNPALLFAIGLSASLARFASAEPSKQADKTARQSTQVAGEGADKRGNAIDRINSEALEENNVEPNQANALDVILAGGGGHLLKGTPKENKASDPKQDNGLGVIGMHGGNKSGTNASGPRSRISPPKPSDLQLEGDTLVRSKESILRVIRQHMGGFRYSHEKALRKDPKVGGELSLKFTIAPSGDITQIDVAKTKTNGPALDDEILGKAKRMRFDQVEEGNVTATYSMVLDKE